jgi:hypothetical protein
MTISLIFYNLNQPPPLMRNQHFLQKRIAILQFLIFIVLTFPVFAQEKKDSTIPVSPAKSFVTTHKGTFGGKPISYKARPVKYI